MAPYIGTGVSIGSGALLGQQAYPSVFALGDSLTHGQAGLSGGWKAQMVTGVTFVGPYTDEVGIKHGGRDGDYLQDTVAADMFDRCASQITAAPADEVWITGGTNDAAGGVASASTMATRLANLITEVRTVHTGTIRVFSPPPWNPATGATTELERFWRRHIQPVCDVFRAAGYPVYFHHTGGQLQTADLDTAMSRHPLDGAYGVNGYGLWAAQNDNVLAGGTALDPNSLGLEFEFLPANYNATTGVWSDSSGNSRDATATSTKPTLATGSTGQQAVRFNASALRTASLGVALTQAVTVIFVADVVNNPATQPVIIDGASTSNRLLIQPSTSNQYRVWAGGAYGTDAELLMTVPHVYSVEFNGVNTKTWCDGNPRYIDLAPGANSMGGLTIGGSGAATPGNLLDCDLYYLGVYHGTLTNAQHYNIACHFRPTHDLWPTFGQVSGW